MGTLMLHLCVLCGKMLEYFELEDKQWKRFTEQATDKMPIYRGLL